MPQTQTKKALIQTFRSATDLIQTHNQRFYFWIVINKKSNAHVDYEKKYCCQRQNWIQKKLNKILHLQVKSRIIKSCPNILSPMYKYVLHLPSIFSNIQGDFGIKTIFNWLN